MLICSCLIQKLTSASNRWHLTGLVNCKSWQRRKIIENETDACSARLSLTRLFFSDLHSSIMTGNYSMDQREGNCMEARMKVTSEEKLTIIISVECVAIIAAVCGNSLVIVAFYKFFNLRTASNVILVSLCTADSLIVIAFIINISGMFLRLSGYHQVHVLKSICEADASLSFTLASVIILHLALISVERFIAVKFSLRYHTIVTKRLALLASIAVWLWAVAVVLVFPKALRASNNNAYRKFVRAMHPCLKMCGSKPGSSNGYLIFFVTSMLIIPLVIILCSYSYIFIVAHKHRKQIRDQGNVQEISNLKREMRGARTLAIVVTVCLLSIVPLLISTCLRFRGKLRDDDTRHPKLKYVKHIVHVFAFCLNAICNPVIYGWRNEQFRGAFRRLLKCAQ